MAIYKGLFGSTTKFVRADNIAQAVHIFRQAFGFAPKGYITRAGDNRLSLGFPAVYDRAVEHEAERASNARLVRTHAKRLPDSRRYSKAVFLAQFGQG